MNESEQLNLIKEITQDIIDNNSEINYDDIIEVKKFIKETIKFISHNISDEFIEYNLNKLLKCVFIFNKNDAGKVIYNKENIKIPDNYKKLVEHVDYIANLPQPEQRTEEWFDMRRNMITASCAAQAINENPYRNQNSDYLILDKLGMGEVFTDNKFVHHGKKYEETATKIYENIYNVVVEEYGLIPHLPEPRISYIGASPDGIASHYTLDNQFSEMVGRMLEIKCPFSRNIKTEGAIDGEICPHYYWCQVQQQLECCDLEYCDFWQCNLKEYLDRDEWLEDKIPTASTEEQNKKIDIPVNCQKGCIIQLLPKNKITEFCLFDAKYIYPPSINMTLFEYDQWILDTISNLHKKYYQLTKNYVFDRVLYWKLENSHNVVIKRDRDWFNKVKSQYKSVWDKVLFLRNNPKEALKFKEEVTKSKKKSIAKKNKDEELFIDSDTEDKQIFVKSKKDHNKENLFIDSDE